MNVQTNIPSPTLHSSMRNDQGSPVPPQKEMPSRVTPDAPRALVQMNLPLCNARPSDSSKQAFYLLSPLSKPLFSQGKHLQPRPSFCPRSDSARRAADLLRDLPRRKFPMLQRSAARREEPEVKEEEDQGTLFPMPRSSSNLLPDMADENMDALMLRTPTPSRPNKRQRLSLPPLPPHVESRRPLVITSSEHVPASIWLPNF